MDVSTVDGNSFLLSSGTRIEYLNGARLVTATTRSVYKRGIGGDVDPMERHPCPLSKTRIKGWGLIDCTGRQTVLLLDDLV